MPLDPQGLLTQHEREMLEDKFDPQRLLTKQERNRTWEGKCPWKRSF